jgi:D-sedoheptulose 7-phosphate isomerase
MEEKFIEQKLLEGANIRKETSVKCLPQISQAADMLFDAFHKNKKVLICGNGGSAADSQHFAAELVGHFRKERKPLPAIALTTDTSILTSVSNDYSFETVFKRQITALGQPGDLLILLSTSGNSKNILEAAKEGRAKGLKIVGLSGKDGGGLKGLCDVCICVPSSETDRIQEVHITICHILCDILESKLFA